ncbi:hypothetical protein FG877_10385 [Enterococcus casseliflavus]|nr:hypothetical protein [Enterococcus casseliflavus]
MVSPNKVFSPKEKLELLNLLEDGTQTGKGYSIAKVNWKGKEMFAIRYDGDNEKDKGFPTTTNGYHPSWFILPVEVARPYLHTFISQKEFQERLKKYLS